MKSTYMHAFMLLACGFTFALMGHTIMGLQALGVPFVSMNIFCHIVACNFLEGTPKDTNFANDRMSCLSCQYQHGVHLLLAILLD